MNSPLDVAWAACGLPPADHGAVPAQAQPLARALEALQRQSSADDVVAVVAVSLTNASDLAHRHGVRAVEQVTATLARRFMQHHLSTRLLAASPLGGFLAAVATHADTCVHEIEVLLAGLRRLVHVDGVRIWPVVTAGVAAVSGHGDARTDIHLAKDAAALAARRCPGHTQWATQSAGTDFDLARHLAVALTDNLGQLTLQYQPLHGLRVDATVGAQAVVCWRHPWRGVVDPAEVIAVAEQAGLIDQFGRWMLREAVKQRAQWHHSHARFRLHVPVSTLQLGSADFVDHLRGLLDEFTVPASAFVLEFSETAYLGEDTRAATTLQRLARLGFGLAIDQFGRGYSALAHLHDLPIDTVKLAPELVTQIATSPGEFAFTRQLLGLLGTLDVMIVADGVSSAIEAAHLRSMGCAFAQGTFFGPAVTAEEFSGLWPADRVATA